MSARSLALLLVYVTLLTGTTPLVGSFAAAGLGQAGIKGSNLWLIIAVLAALVAIWLAWRDVRLSGLLTVVLEGTSVLAILLLAIIVLMRVPLASTRNSSRPTFEAPRGHRRRLIVLWLTL
jgi:amino acid transporter